MSDLIKSGSTVEERRNRRIATRGLHPDKLSFKLALLKPAEVLFIEIARAGYARLVDRVYLAAKTKALNGAQFKCALLVCRNLSAPAEETFIARIERLS